MKLNCMVCTHLVVKSINFSLFVLKHSAIALVAELHLHFDGPVVPDEQKMPIKSFFGSHCIGLKEDKKHKITYLSCGTI